MFGAQIDFGMEKYAEYFAAGGLQALLFDYRGFGKGQAIERERLNSLVYCPRLLLLSPCRLALSLSLETSEVSWAPLARKRKIASHADVPMCFLGSPSFFATAGSSDGAVRNLCDPTLHLADWRAALLHLAQRPTGRKAESRGPVGLWGSSMSGGHVLVLAGEASEQERLSEAGSSSSSAVRAVVAQSPHLDGRLNRAKNLQPPPDGRGWAGALRLSRAAAADWLRSAVGLPPAYVPIVGPLGSVSLMPLPPGELELYFAKHPSADDAAKGGGWRNRAPARLALKVGSYNPIDRVALIDAPVLFVAATNDALCPASLVAAAYDACGGSTRGRHGVSGGKCELLNVDCGHFGLYAGAPFDQAAGAMLAFFKKYLA